MEASAYPAPSELTPARVGVRAPLLRLRSDEQLVALFRAGEDEAFRVIYERYRTRLFAYARQMLSGSRQDAEDALQDVFVRAYAGLRAGDGRLALRAWLYRVAHNRCVDELRRPVPPAPEVLQLVRPPVLDPIAEAEQRESLRRLIEDVRRLPEQQRSALLMRELGGMPYVEVSDALGVSDSAVKSLLVRARVSLAQAAEARDTACSDIREELVVAHDRGVRPSGTARRHLRDCAGCGEFRRELRSTRRQLAALVPTVAPPLTVLGNLLGFGGSAGSGAAASGGAAAGGGAAAMTGGGAASVGLLASGAGHVATLLAAAVVTAGGAVEIQRTIVQPSHRPTGHRVAIRRGTDQVVSVAISTPAAPAAGVPAAVAAAPGAPASQHWRAGPRRASATTAPANAAGPGLVLRRSTRPTELNAGSTADPSAPPSPRASPVGTTTGEGSGGTTSPPPVDGVGSAPPPVPTPPAPGSGLPPSGNGAGTSTPDPSGGTGPSSAGDGSPSADGSTGSATPATN